MSDILVIALLVLLNIQIYLLARGAEMESRKMAHRHGELVATLTSDIENDYE